MTYLRLIYASRPVDYDAATLDDILMDARSRNVQDDVTGALIARSDIYLQLLEGEPLAVDRTYGRIMRDPRHENLQILVRRLTGWRLFSDWTMRGAPARGWMWSPRDVATGIPTRATRPEVEAIFVRLWRESLARPVRRFGLRKRSNT